MVLLVLSLLSGGTGGWWHSSSGGGIVIGLSGGVAAGALARRGLTSGGAVVHGVALSVGGDTKGTAQAAQEGRPVCGIRSPLWFRKK